MNKHGEVGAFWQAFLASLPEGSEPSPGSYEAWSFCDNEKDANELGDLVIAGIKTATCRRPADESLRKRCRLCASAFA